jgi:hypothetical protein
VTSSYEQTAPFKDIAAKGFVLECAFAGFLIMCLFVHFIQRKSFDSVGPTPL